MVGYHSEHARFYDVQMRAIDREDVSFYIEKAREVDGSVLELACGTGRIYLELLRHDIDADGFDASEATLTVLREKAEEQRLEPSVWQADMAEFDTDREYDLVICPFNAIQHLLTIDDQLSALQCIHDALSPSSRFLFDVFIPSFEIICETYEEWSTKEVTYQGEPHEHRSRTRIADEVEQQFIVENELVDSAGDQVFTSEYQLKMLPKREIELLARLSPFSDWHITSDFDDTPIRDGGSIQVWSLKK